MHMLSCKPQLQLDCTHPHTSLCFQSNLIQPSFHCSPLLHFYYIPFTHLFVQSSACLSPVSFLCPLCTLPSFPTPLPHCSLLPFLPHCAVVPFISSWWSCNWIRCRMATDSHTLGRTNAHTLSRPQHRHQVFVLWWIICAPPHMQHVQYNDVFGIVECPIRVTQPWVVI